MRLRIDIPNDAPRVRRSSVRAVCTVPEPSITECLVGSAKTSKIAWLRAAMNRSALKLEEAMSRSLSPRRDRLPRQKLPAQPRLESPHPAYWDSRVVAGTTVMWARRGAARENCQHG